MHTPVQRPHPLGLDGNGQRHKLVDQPAQLIGIQHLDRRPLGHRGAPQLADCAERQSDRLALSRGLIPESESEDLLEKLRREDWTHSGEAKSLVEVGRVGLVSEMVQPGRWVSEAVGAREEMSAGEEGGGFERGRGGDRSAQASAPLGTPDATMHAPTPQTKSKPL